MVPVVVAPLTFPLSPSGCPLIGRVTLPHRMWQCVSTAALILTSQTLVCLDCYIKQKLLPYLFIYLVTGLTIYRPGFTPGSVHVGFVALGQVSL
jgi:hypothetical protein